MSQLRVPINPHDHILGDPDAPVSMVEYGDYECPFCAAAHPVVKAVIARFGDNLAFVFRHFPLTEVHRNAEIAAETAEFAGAHGRFWQMHDAIYANSDHLSPQVLYTLASMLHLSQMELQKALAARTYAGKVYQDFIGGVRSGVAGTPTFFIDGEQYVGAHSAPDLIEAIEARMLAPVM